MLNIMYDMNEREDGKNITRIWGKEKVEGTL